MHGFVAFLKRIDEKLTRLEEAAVAALLFVMTAVIFISVVERFILKMGITWIEEFARYLSVWAAFIGSGLAVKKCAHIGIEAFVQILPEKARYYEDRLVDLIGIAFAVVIFVVGVDFLGKLIDSNQLSPALRINIAWAYAAVPVGCALMGVHYAIRLVTGLLDRPPVCECEDKWGV